MRPQRPPSPPDRLSELQRRITRLLKTGGNFGRCYECEQDVYYRTATSGRLLRFNPDGTDHKFRKQEAAESV